MFATKTVSYQVVSEPEAERPMRRLMLSSRCGLVTSDPGRGQLRAKSVASQWVGLDMGKGYEREQSEMLSRC